MVGYRSRPRKGKTGGWLAEEGPHSARLLALLRHQYEQSLEQRQFTSMLPPESGQMTQLRFASAGRWDGESSASPASVAAHDRAEASRVGRPSRAASNSVPEPIPLAPLLLTDYRPPALRAHPHHESNWLHLDFFVAYSQLPTLRVDAVPADLSRSALGGGRPLYTFNTAAASVSVDDLKDCRPESNMSDPVIDFCSLLLNATPGRRFWVAPTEPTTRVCNGWDAPLPGDLPGLDHIFLP